MKKKKVFTIPVTFTFEGEFYIKASSEDEAIDIAKLHCGMISQFGDIQSSLPDDDVDWEFPIRAEKQVLSLGE